MQRLFRLRSLQTTIGLAAALSAPSFCLAQDGHPAKPADSTLDSILTELEAHVENYNHSVPSFLCNEHVVSEMDPAPVPGGSRKTVTEAVFRVRRYSGPNGQYQLNESRILKSIDGKALPDGPTAEVTDLIAPMTVTGIFSNGLNLVAFSGKACFRYRLHTPRKGHGSDRMVIDFEDLPRNERGEGCPTNGTISGHAFINQSTMRVVRLETKTRDHESQPGLKETWDWSIDYAPVVLSGMTFWMPASIHSRAVPDADSAAALTPSSGSGRRGGAAPMGSSATRPLTYTLEAKYSDYHLLNVTSRIVPTSEAGAQPPPAPTSPATSSPLPPPAPEP